MARTETLRPEESLLPLLLLFCVAAAASAAGITDGGISDAVDEELLMDPAVPEAFIDVSTVEGIVTLEGSVGGVLASRRAVRVAKTVRGVKGVVNRIKARPEDLPDSIVIGEVARAMERDPYVETFDIDVAVEDGRVYLNGVVDSHFDRSRADQVAAAQRGVAAVSNLIDVNEPRPGAYHPLVDRWRMADYRWYSLPPADALPAIGDWQIARNVRPQLRWSPPSMTERLPWPEPWTPGPGETPRPETPCRRALRPWTTTSGWKAHRTT